MFAQILVAVTVIFSAFLSRSPLIMTTTTPSGNKPWADGPMKLIITPAYTTKKTDIFTTGATHMALLHNAVFRGYNSIWHQATHVQDSEKADFIGYCLTWFRFVKSHHDDEESNLFPRVEELLNDKTIWEETQQEHGKSLQRNCAR